MGAVTASRIAPDCPVTICSQIPAMEILGSTVGRLLFQNSGNPSPRKTQSVYIIYNVYIYNIYILSQLQNCTGALNYWLWGVICEASADRFCTVFL